MQLFYLLILPQISMLPLNLAPFSIIFTISTMFNIFFFFSTSGIFLVSVALDYIHTRVNLVGSYER